MSIEARCTYLTRISRRSSAPVDLKELVVVLKASNREVVLRRKDLREYEQQNRNVLNTARKLKRCLRTAERKSQRLKMSVGLFECDSIRLPGVFVSEPWLF